MNDVPNEYDEPITIRIAVPHYNHLVVTLQSETTTI